jgi:hypothetical protein
MCGLPISLFGWAATWDQEGLGDNLNVGCSTPEPHIKKTFTLQKLLIAKDRERCIDILELVQAALIKLCLRMPG